MEKIGGKQIYIVLAVIRKKVFVAWVSRQFFHVLPIPSSRLFEYFFF